VVAGAAAEQRRPAGAAKQTVVCRPGRHRRQRGRIRLERVAAGAAEQGDRTGPARNTNLPVPPSTGPAWRRSRRWCRGHAGVDRVAPVDWTLSLPLPSSIRLRPPPAAMVSLPPPNARIVSLPPPV